MREGKPSFTAEVVCFMRASEQNRPAHARVLDDPFAARFLGPLLGSLHRLRLRLPADPFFGLSGFVIARHRFIDEHLLAALDDGAEQVVVLGAGYDARAYRFADIVGDRPFFEVDHPATGARKQQLVAELGLPRPPGLRYVAVDFQRERFDERLVAQGFDPTRRSFFVWEGVVMYLAQRAVVGTLSMLGALCAPGSALAMDAWYLDDGGDARAMIHRLAAGMMPLIGEPITYSIHPGDAPVLLREHGFGCDDLARAEDLATRYLSEQQGVMQTGYVLHAVRGGR